MTISLDGFVADQNGNAGRLYPDLAALRHTAYMKDAIEQTGAVLMGRRTFEMADPDSYVGNYEFQMPIFVLTHHPPRVAPKQDQHLTFTFVTILSFNVFAILEVKQCPKLRIALQYDAAATAAIAAIRSSLVYEFFAMEMPATRTALARF